jgi:hypothetical protein
MKEIGNHFICKLIKERSVCDENIENFGTEEVSFTTRSVQKKNFISLHAGSWSMMSSDRLLN